MIQEITIRFGEGTGYDVLKDGLSSGGGLTVGEMIEQVLSISAPIAAPTLMSGKHPRYRMARPYKWGTGNLRDTAPEIPVFRFDEGSGA